MGKLTPTEGVFLQHYLGSVVRGGIQYEETKTHINHVDPQLCRWKPSDKEAFIVTETEEDIVPELLLTTYECKSSNCAKRSMQVQLKWYPLLG